jgi:5'-methylthioadenosine phosphorylase
VPPTLARLAVVGGHNLLGSGFAQGAERRDVEAGDRIVTTLDCGPFVMLQRHGFGPYVPPHEIDHVANMRALAELGCDRVLAIGSVGSLRLDRPVGTFLAAGDFVALTAPPLMSSPGRSVHHMALFDPEWRSRVVAAWREAAPEPPLVDGGVYWQTTGPRFETPAEIRVLATFADVVGMTVGSECTAACQLGLAYAVVCVVDNLANGLGADLLTPEEFDAGTASNRARLLAALDRVLPELT